MEDAAPRAKTCGVDVTAPPRLIAETGTDAESRFAVLAGVRIDDPAAVAQKLVDADEERILDVMQELATDVRVCFAAKHKLTEDWACAFMAVLADHRFPGSRRG